MSIRKIKFKRYNQKGLWLKSQPICPECGKRGKHWVENPFYVPGLNGGSLFTFGPLDQAPGFWICDKFYGPDGRRII